MIIEMIMNILYGVVNFILSMMPTVTLTWLHNVTTAWNNFIDILNPIWFFVPIGSIVLAINAIMYLHLTQLAWYMINWLIRKIPTVN